MLKNKYAFERGRVAYKSTMGCLISPDGRRAPAAAAWAAIVFYEFLSARTGQETTNKYVMVPTVDRPDQRRT